MAALAAARGTYRTHTCPTSTSPPSPARQARPGHPPGRWPGARPQHHPHHQRRRLAMPHPPPLVRRPRRPPKRLVRPTRNHRVPRPTRAHARQPTQRAPRQHHCNHTRERDRPCMLLHLPALPATASHRALVGVSRSDMQPFVLHRYPTCMHCGRITHITCQWCSTWRARLQPPLPSQPARRSCSGARKPPGTSWAAGGSTQRTGPV